MVAQTVKYLPAMQETRVQSLGWEDPLEKEMATHSSTLAWKMPWTEEPGRLQSMGSQSQTRLSDDTLHLRARKDFEMILFIPWVAEGKTFCLSMLESLKYDMKLHT